MATSKDQKNIIKTRDDKNPVYFISTAESKYKLDQGQECSWIKSEDEFHSSKLRERIEPWLTSLVQSDHLSLLVGSGLSYAVKDIASPGKIDQSTASQVKKVKSHMEGLSFSSYGEEIRTMVEKSAKLAGRESPNFEDEIRVANELCRGLEIFTSTNHIGHKKAIIADKRVKNLRTEINSKLTQFAHNILNDEKIIATANEDSRQETFNILTNFLMSFASRTGTRERLNIFTTNYDRIIEVGAELAGLHLLDRFLGNIHPIFRSSRLGLDLHYNPPGIRGEPRYLEGVTRFTKLHGSIDWVQTGKDIRRIGLPFGAETIDPYLNAPGLLKTSTQEIMIYPNSSKDRETAQYPYVDLFRDFAAACCRPNCTLFTYGYSFGDEHINRVIEDMLTIPSTHLVVMALEDPMNRIMNTYNKLGRSSQITLLIGNALGDFQTLVNNYLPKAAIDRTTIRMNELLKKRLGPEGDDNKNQSDKDVQS